MTNVIIIYESKYGNTKRVAETIMEGMRQKGIETVLSDIKEVDLNKISNYDGILLGSPNHIGGPTRSVKKCIDELGKLGLKGKPTAVFDTYMGKDFEKAAKKMEKQIAEKAPDMRLLSLGLSIRVQGMKGPILQEELAKCHEFGKEIAGKIAP